MASFNAALDFLERKYGNPSQPPAGDVGMDPSAAPTPRQGAQIIDFETPLPEMDPAAGAVDMPPEQDQAMVPLQDEEPAQDYTPPRVSRVEQGDTFNAALDFLTRKYGDPQQAATQQAVAEATTPDDRLPIATPELADALGVLDYRDPQEGQRRQQAAAVGEILNLPMFERVNLGAAPVNPDGTVTIRRAQAVSPEAQAAADARMANIRTMAAGEMLVEESPKEVGTLQGIANAAQNAFDSARQALMATNGLDANDASEIARIEYNKAARRVAPGYAAYQQAEGWDAAKAFAKNPFEVTTNIITEGLAGSWPALAGGLATGATTAAVTAVAGSVVPGVGNVIGAGGGFTAGMIGGTGAGSFATEYGGKILEELQTAGMNPKDPESIANFFSNETLMAEAKDAALKRGVPVAAFDALSAGIAGRVGSVFRAAAKTPVRLAVTEGAIQGGLGGAGEVAGSVAAGDPVNPKAVFGEVIGEVGPAAIEIAAGRAASATQPAPGEVPQNFTPISSPAPAPGPVAPATAPQNLGKVRAPEIPIDQAALDEAFGSPFAPPQPAPADPFAPSPEAPAATRPAFSFSTDAITPEQTALATDFSNRLTGQLRTQGILDTASTLDLAPVNLDRVDAGAPLADFIDNFSRLTGTRIQFVKASDPNIFGGAVRSDDAQTIYLNADSQRPVASLIGHEYGHTLQYSNPALYKDLRRVVATYTDSYRTRARESAAAPIYRTGPATQRVRTQTAELTNNTLGDAFLDPEFWRSVQNENRPLIQKIWTSFNEWVDSLLTRQSQSTWGTPQFATDLTALRRDLAKTIAPALRPPTRSFGNAQVTAKPGVIDLAIEAYHGTPHKVDRFSTKKIGTGEGAQVYGWGLYFAEKFGVAKKYRDDLTPDPVAKINKHLSLIGLGGHSASSKLAEKLVGNGGDLSLASSEFRKEGNKQIADLIDKRVKEGRKSLDVNKGNLYTVELDVEPEDLLDWDKPLSEQSEKVKEAFNLKIWNEDRFKITDLDEIDNILSKDATLGEAYQLMGEPKDVSLHLLAAGIPGIRYLDGDSRAKGQGTSNYVIFDENLIKVTAENGQPVSREIAFASEPSNQQPKPQVYSDNFKNWFGEWETNFQQSSKVVDEAGQPLVVYHGTQRPDRVDRRFQKKRATSGPMAFFTDNPEIGSKYATGKADTSLDMPSDYAGWFKYKGKGMRSPVDIDRAWWSLSPEERNTINQRIYTVGYQNSDEATGQIVSNTESIMGRDSIDYELRKARGNGLRALTEIWLNSGSLYDDEQTFMQVLQAAGIDISKVNYDSPNAVKSAVYPVYLSIKNPLDTANIPADVVSALEQAGKRKRAKVSAGNNPDAWDKNTISGQEWLQVLRDNLANGTSTAWTRIPDWVSETLSLLGYDGIKDTGGKMGGDKHAVWIPFEETQVKSATGNKGTFNPESSYIDLAAEPKPRSFPQTVTAAPGVAPEVKAQLTALDYDPISNAQTVASARSRIDAAGSMDSAVTQFMGNAANPDFQPTAVDYATGIELLGQLQSRGRHEDAAAIADFMARAGTTQGQAIQALSLISRLTPAGIEAFASRQITRAARNDPKIEELIQDNQRLRAEIATAKRDSATSAIVDNRAAIKAALPAGADPVATNIAIREAILQSPTPLAAQAATARILQDNGLSERAAIRIAQSITKDFLKTTIDSRAKVLQDLLALAEKDRRLNKSKLGALIRLNREGKLSDSRLHADMAKMLGIPAWTAEHSAKVQRLINERERATDPRVKLVKAAEALDVIYREAMPPGILDKIDTYQTMAMLLNGLTQVRNLVGNISMAGVEIASDTVAQALDAVVGLGTGQRTRTGLDLGTRLTELGAGFQDIRAGYQFARAEGKGRRESFKEGVQTLIRLGRIYSSGKYDSQELTRYTGPVFNNPVMQTLENTLGAALSLADRGFYESAFKASLQNRMRTAAQNGTPMLAPDPDMIEQARMDAARAIYQDENIASKGFSGIRRVLNANKRWGLGSMVLKFTQVPGSILVRGLEFTPINTIRVLYETVAPLLPRTVGRYHIGKDFDQKAFTDAFARSLIGTGFLATGYWLAHLGILSGGMDSDDENERELAKAEGWGPYRINVSALQRAMVTGNFWTRQPRLKTDRVVKYDWLAPMSIGVAMGANMREGKDKILKEIQAGKRTSDFATTANWLLAAAGETAGVTVSAMNTVLEQPMLSNLNQLFVTAGHSDPISALVKTAADIPGTMIPTVVKQWARYEDNIVRETRDGYDGKLKFRQTVNELKAMLPGVSKTLPPRYDMEGNPVERFPNNGNTFFNVALNPAFVGYIKKSKLLSEMSDVYKATADGGVVPSRIPAKVSLENVEITLMPDEISALQKEYGMLSVAAAEKFVFSDPYYEKATWEQRAHALQKALTMAAKAAKYRVLQSRPDLYQRAKAEHIQRMESQRAANQQAQQDLAAVSQAMSQLQPGP